MKKLNTSVLFLILDSNLASSRVRVLNLLPFFEAAGIRCEVTMFPKKISEKIKLLTKVSQFDIVFLQKKMLGWFAMKLLSSKAKQIIFDFDDAIYLRQDSLSNQKSLLRQLKFKSVVSGADMVFAGNKILADYARTFNSCVDIIPSAVPVNGIAVKEWEKKNETFVIGWIGSKKNLQYIKIIEPALKKLAKEYQIEFRVVSDGEINIPGVKVKNLKWTLQGQELEIAKFDVGVMPLYNDPWAEGKCGYKALQYMAAGIPAICSDVGANAESIRHNENGYKVSSDEEYYFYLKKLIENRSLCASLGKKAMEEINNSYSLEVVSEKIINNFKLLCENKNLKK